MRGKACSRRGTLATVTAGWRRALPLITATIMLLPGGDAFAAPPVDGPGAASTTYLVDQVTTSGLTQAGTERRCIVRCNDPDRPPPGSRLREAATKARTAVQEAREELQETRQDVREAVQEAREDARETTGRVREAAGEVKEAAGDVKEAGSVREALGEVKEGAGEVKEAIAEPEPTEETASAESEQQSPPQAAAQSTQAAAAPPAAPSQPNPAASAVSAPPAPAAISAPSAALDPTPIDQVDPSVQTVVPRPDGAAGGPNTAAQRTESGTLSQGKGPDAATPPVPAPALAATPPSVEPEAPAAAMAPPAAPAVAVPQVVADTPNLPAAADKPDDTSADVTPVADSQDDLAKWSVPLAVAGAALAGLALVFPMARRQQPVLGAARGDAPDASRRVQGPTWPGHAAGADPTLLTRPMRPAPNARLNGSPVPYLSAVRTPADDRSSIGHSTNVAGLYWSDQAADERADRALA